MALLWRQTLANTTYEVRTAGHSVRLYTNGILHTQYNPNHSMTGSVWDLLLMGAFFLPKDALKRVLVLGVGGGAVLHQIRTFFPSADIVGVELNGTHLQIARKYFKLKSSKIKLIEADAIEWLTSYQGSSFDLIIEDLFCEVDGEPDRVKLVDQLWVDEITRNLSPQGCAVLNFIDSQKFNKATSLFEKNSYQSGFRLSTKNCFNIVGIYTKAAASCELLRSNLRQFAELDTRKKSCRLKYHIKTIF